MSQIEIKLKGSFFWYFCAYSSCRYRKEYSIKCVKEWDSSRSDTNRLLSLLGMGNLRVTLSHRYFNFHFIQE